jgi:hypothetical protein
MRERDPHNTTNNTQQTTHDSMATVTVCEHLQKSTGSECSSPSSDCEGGREREGERERERARGERRARGGSSVENTYCASARLLTPPSPTPETCSYARSARSAPRAALATARAAARGAARWRAHTAGTTKRTHTQHTHATKESVTGFAVPLFRRVFVIDVARAACFFLGGSIATAHLELDHLHRLVVIVESSGHCVGRV